MKLLLHCGNGRASSDSSLTRLWRDVRERASKMRQRRSSNARSEPGWLPYGLLTTHESVIKHGAARSYTLLRELPHPWMKTSELPHPWLASREEISRIPRRFEFLIKWRQTSFSRVVSHLALIAAVYLLEFKKNETCFWWKDFGLEDNVPGFCSGCPFEGAAGRRARQNDVRIRLWGDVASRTMHDSSERFDFAKPRECILRSFTWLYGIAWKHP